MITDYMTTKYMAFKLIEQKPKTQVWAVLNNKSGFRLGVIEWYGPWRQYCFFPTADTVFNIGCLFDISNFIKGLRK